jgi:glycosyltransferase involved in cell wall biosynthesis
MSSSKVLVIVAIVVITVTVILSIILPLTIKNSPASSSTLLWIKASRLEKKQHVLPYNVACCFCIRDCGKYLKQVFSNVERLRKRFRKMYCIFVYDNCSDDSETLLQQYEKLHDNVILFHNVNNTSPLRTVRIASSRNVNLNILYQLPDVIDYHFAIDADDRNSDPWDIDRIVASIEDRNDWDCLSFNRPDYYDIWALFFDNYKHHCWGFGFMCSQVIDVMHKDIVAKLEALKPLDQLLDCYSAFCGFAIYRTPVFKGLRYDGLYVNIKEFFTDQDRLDTMAHLKQRLPKEVGDLLKLDDGVINQEQCDHVYLHLSARRYRNARIRISPHSLFLS